MAQLAAPRADAPGDSSPNRPYPWCRGRLVRGPNSVSLRRLAAQPRWRRGRPPGRAVGGEERLRKPTRVRGLVAAAAVLIAACSGSTASAPRAGRQRGGKPAGGRRSGGREPERRSQSPAAGAANVRLQLQWVPQAQFAGYFAADAQGLLHGRGPQRQRSSPAARPSRRRPSARPRRSRVHDRVGAQGARGSRAKGHPTSSTSPRSSSAPARGPCPWKDSIVDDSILPADFKGKKVGVWDFGNEYEVTAGRPNRPDAGPTGTDYTKVIQPFNMTPAAEHGRSTSPRR